MTTAVKLRLVKNFFWPAADADTMRKADHKYMKSHGLTSGLIPRIHRTVYRYF